MVLATALCIWSVVDFLFFHHKISDVFYACSFATWLYALLSSRRRPGEAALVVFAIGFALSKVGW